MKQGLEILTKSDVETKRLGALLAQTILQSAHKKKATIISLEGELGAGKTTFAQGFAEGLGIREKVKSPTFVILKIYSIKKNDFIHIDAYRIRTKDLLILGWKKFIRNPENIVLVEWGDRIKRILPKNVVRIKFVHSKEKHRIIKIIAQ